MRTRPIGTGPFKFVEFNQNDGLKFAWSLNIICNGVDDRDQNYYEKFSCKSERNYTGYCNPEIEKLLDDGARPVLLWNRAAICMQPFVKGYVAGVRAGPGESSGSSRRAWTGSASGRAGSSAWGHP